MTESKLEFIVMLSIGKYTISQYSDGKIWINEDDGEGMKINEELFYLCIKKFYNDNF